MEEAPLPAGPFGTVLADPPWRFQNRSGMVAPEHKRLRRDDTMDWKEIAARPVADVMAGRRQVNIIETRKREHSRKPDERYPIIESCSPGPFVELFARRARPGWQAWGAEAPGDG